MDFFFFTIRLKFVNRDLFEQIFPELKKTIKGQRFFRCFQITDTEFIFDLKLDDSRFLLINHASSDPRIYLAKRRLRELEKTALHPSGFVQFIMNKIIFGDVVAVTSDTDLSILYIDLRVTERNVVEETYRLVIQLDRGRSNIFLLDNKDVILTASANKDIHGQKIGDIYLKPEAQRLSQTTKIPDDLLDAESSFPISDHLDAKYSEIAARSAFDALARAALKKVTAALKKKQKLAENLNSDRTDHGDAEVWKRYGDLLLANAYNARRDGSAFVVMDYFDPELAEIKIEAEQNDTPTTAAETYFRKYTRARNAAVQIAERMASATKAIENAAAELERVQTAIAEQDAEFLTCIVGEKAPKITVKAAKRSAEVDKAVRTFISSDGFEILVGKKAKDNDQLTFRLAKSQDTWMHAADYPGSHVVVRNPNRKEIPSRTLVEAAEIAAFYSQGRTQTKAAVNYTLKKFVNKPKGAPPGLVSLASFKTLLVVPKVGLQLKDVVK